MLGKVKEIRRKIRTSLDKEQVLVIETGRVLTGPGNIETSLKAIRAECRAE